MIASIENGDLSIIATNDTENKELKEWLEKYNNNDVSIHASKEDKCISKFQCVVLEFKPEFRQSIEDFL